MTDVKENGSFRGMRRFKQQIPERECIEILKNEMRGVLAVSGDNGYPYAFPMDFVYDGGKIYFHSAKEGYKIDCLKRNDKASFCVYDKGFIKDGDWALNIKSVVIFGHIRFIDDEREAEDKLRRLGLKYFPEPSDVEKEIKKYFSRVLMLELTIDHITGKLVNES